MARTIIKLPKVKTLAEYYEWCKAQETPTLDLEVSMKRRGYYPYAFTLEKDGRIHYLISDGVSRGACKIENFNKVFKFSLVEV